MSAQSTTSTTATTAAAAAAAAAASGQPFQHVPPVQQQRALMSVAVDAIGKPALARTGAALAANKQDAEKNEKGAMAGVRVAARPAGAPAAAPAAAAAGGGAAGAGIQEVEVGREQAFDMKPGKNIQFVIGDVFSSYVVVAKFYKNDGNWGNIGFMHHEIEGYDDDFNGLTQLLDGNDHYANVRVSIYASTPRAQDISSAIKKQMANNPKFLMEEEVLNPFNLTQKGLNEYAKEIEDLDFSLTVTISPAGNVTVASERPFAQKMDMIELATLAQRNMIIEALAAIPAEFVRGNPNALSGASVIQGGAKK